VFESPAPGVLPERAVENLLAQHLAPQCQKDNRGFDVRQAEQVVAGPVAVGRGEHRLGGGQLVGGDDQLALLLASTRFIPFPVAFLGEGINEGVETFVHPGIAALI
jgi:hypothetical protein